MAKAAGAGRGARIGPSFAGWSLGWTLNLEVDGDSFCFGGWLARSLSPSRVDTMRERRGMVAAIPCLEHAAAGWPPNRFGQEERREEGGGVSLQRR